LACTRIPIFRLGLRIWEYIIADRW
jgi:hypothetical protein